MRSRVILAAILAAICTGCPPDPKPVDVPPEPFTLVAEVLLHPRCVNCHPTGDTPLIGEDSQPHGMEVKRGPEGRGITTTMCTNCHQTENLPGEHMPPGAPNWHMPAANMPMVFEGRTPAMLCKQLVDPTQNGGKTTSEILEHMKSDALVKWGWSPGDGRKPAPGTHEDFAAAATAWIGGGASCPSK